MTLGDVVLYGGVYRILRNMGSPVMQEESNHNRVKDSSASRVSVRFLKVSESAMGKFCEVYLEIRSQLDND